MHLSDQQTKTDKPDPTNISHSSTRRRDSSSAHIAPPPKRKRFLPTETQQPLLSRPTDFIPPPNTSSGTVPRPRPPIEVIDLDADDTNHAVNNQSNSNLNKSIVVIDLDGDDSPPKPSRPNPPPVPTLDEQNSIAQTHSSAPVLHTDGEDSTVVSPNTPSSPIQAQHTSSGFNPSPTAETTAPNPTTNTISLTPPNSDTIEDKCNIRATPTKQPVTSLSNTAVNENTSPEITPAVGGTESLQAPTPQNPSNSIDANATVSQAKPPLPNTAPPTILLPPTTNQFPNEHSNIQNEYQVSRNISPNNRLAHIGSNGHQVESIEILDSDDEDQSVPRGTENTVVSSRVEAPPAPSFKPGLRLVSGNAIAPPPSLPDRYNPTAFPAATPQMSVETGAPHTPQLQMTHVGPLPSVTNTLPSSQLPATVISNIQSHQILHEANNNFNLAPPAAVSAPTVAVNQRSIPAMVPPALSNTIPKLATPAPMPVPQNSSDHLIPITNAEGQTQWTFAPFASQGQSTLPLPRSGFNTPGTNTAGIPSHSNPVTASTQSTALASQPLHQQPLALPTNFPGNYSVPEVLDVDHTIENPSLPMGVGMLGGTPGAPSTLNHLPPTIPSSSTTGGLTEHGLRTLVKQHRLTADADAEAETPSEMTIKLMPHQRKALEWMTKRERPMDLGEDVVAEDDECLGGILADEQGLGKTLTMIAVMLKNKPKVAIRNGIKMVDDRPFSPDATSRNVKKKNRGNFSNDKSGDNAENSIAQSADSDLGDFIVVDDDYYCKSMKRKRDKSNDVPWRTLVVCPLSLIHQWRKEIEDNIEKKHIPSICIYHGPKREKYAENLKRYDVVITTYSTLANEYPKVLKDLPENELRKKANLKLITRKPGPVFQFKWRRVVLDEAHYVKRRETQNWKAVMSLQSSMRWCLTGTPIANSVDDIYSLFCFVRYNFVPNVESWNNNWKKLLENTNEYIRNQAFKRFQTICGIVVLRRTKKDTINGKYLLSLPERVIHVIDVKFDDEIERNEYHRSSLKSMKELGDQLKEQSSIQRNLINYSSVLVALLRLRQKCCHPFLEEYSRINSRKSSSLEETQNKSQVSNRFHTPYSFEELEEAMELLEGQQSMLDIIDESVRARIELQLKPKEKQQQFDQSVNTSANVFQCEGCLAINERWEEGMYFSCGDRFCSDCCEKARRIGSCLRCSKPLGSDGGGEVNANELRMEIHARVISQEGELASAGICGRVVREWMREEIEKQRLVKDKEFESDDEDIPDRKSIRNGKFDLNRNKNTRQFATTKRHSRKSWNLGNDDDSDNAESDDESEVDRQGVLDILDEDDVDEEDRSKKINNEQDDIVQTDVSGIKLRNVLSDSEKRLSNRKKLDDDEDDDNDEDEDENEDEEDDEEKKERALLEARKKKIMESLKRPSTKIRIILSELNKVRDEGKGEKTLIFSQWTTMLDIVEFHIIQEGHRICRLDGTMPIEERERQIEEFKKSKRKNVLLISLKCGGTGLNLTVASRVILMDVWWNPCVEEQAIDRVHRIGQTKPVHVIKFKILGTVEERIYKICEVKRSRVSGALGESSAKSLGRQKLSMSELIGIFREEAAHVSNAMPGSAAAAIANNILSYPAVGSSHP